MDGGMSSLCGYHEGPEDYWSHGAFSAAGAAEQERMFRAEATIRRLRHLLLVTRKERDEARSHLHLLLAELARSPAATSLAASDSFSRVSSFPESQVTSAGFCFFDNTMSLVERLAMNRPLPVKGRLWEAMREISAAAPTLGQLLAEVPLPRWENPPPLQAIFVPPSNLGAAAARMQQGCLPRQEVVGGSTCMGKRPPECSAAAGGAQGISQDGKRQKS